MFRLWQCIDFTGTYNVFPQEKLFRNHGFFVLLHSIKQAPRIDPENVTWYDILDCGKMSYRAIFALSLRIDMALYTLPPFYFDISLSMLFRNYQVFFHGI